MTRRLHDDGAMHSRALELICTLELAPLPEGGHYQRVYESTRRVEVNAVLRPALTSIQYLLIHGEALGSGRCDRSVGLSGRQRYRTADV